MVASLGRIQHGARAVVVALVAFANVSAAKGSRVVVHERIPPDPAEDLAMRVALAGNLPAALQTRTGAVAAPDPEAPPATSDVPYASNGAHDAFRADLDTRRPDITSYSDPFTPSTAPFKRLAAFDAVLDDYTLAVRDPRLVAMSTTGSLGADEDAFFSDLVVEVDSERRVRIPSVGPGTRILRARLGVGADDRPVRIFRDGADNWFLESSGAAASGVARLVSELAIARGALGGSVTDAPWNELPLTPRLPENVARDASVVAAAIGVSRDMRPRDVLLALVRYFRGFAESGEKPPARGNIYLDLALSKKGVCRHRAFAFLVTAQGLGIPTRMVLNEAHAWVEVHDGSLWRRIDLGGAGQMNDAASLRALQDRPVYEPSADPFPWPEGAASGEHMVDEGRKAIGRVASPPGTSPDMGGAAGRASDAGDAVPRPASVDDFGTNAPASDSEATAGDDDRPESVITLAIDSPVSPHRGDPLVMHGSVHADGAACPHLSVDVLLRSPSSSIYMGSLATSDNGIFAGRIIVPFSPALGDYDVVASTEGDARCGRDAHHPAKSSQQKP